MHFSAPSCHQYKGNACVVFVYRQTLDTCRVFNKTVTILSVETVGMPVTQRNRMSASKEDG